MMRNLIRSSPEHFRTQRNPTCRNQMLFRKRELRYLSRTRYPSQKKKHRQTSFSRTTPYQLLSMRSSDLQSCAFLVLCLLAFLMMPSGTDVGSFWLSSCHLGTSLAYPVYLFCCLNCVYVASKLLHHVCVQYSLTPYPLGFKYLPLRVLRFSWRSVHELLQQHLHSEEMQ